MIQIAFNACIRIVVSTRVALLVARYTLSFDAIPGALWWTELT